MSADSSRIIVGTAGHIDHGKTSLIRRLTGVDTDRLPEEKKRGITIVLGFAPLELGDGRRVGVVDVPGHERFVKNMVAGAGGIDVVLMVVAADEGMMPQTREHLEICGLLGVRRGVVALTKIDRAGELAELAVEDVRDEVRGTFLDGAPIVPCSSVTGEGIDAVRAALTEVVTGVEARRLDRPTLLPIDRLFTVKGFGSVVTGTLVQGQLRVGDTVDVLPEVPGRALERGAKVRNLQVFGEDVEIAYGGQRTAVNLQGVDLDALCVGQNLLGRGVSAPTRRISARIQHLSSRKKKLKTGAKAILHTGTALVEASLTLLDVDALEPGHTGLATVRLAEPVAVLPGQRFILRGFEASERAGHTVGGGVVLDPEPPRRRRLRDETRRVLTRLARLVDDGPDDGRATEALHALVAERGPAGLPISALARRLALSEKATQKATKGPEAKRALATVGTQVVALEALDGLEAKILDKTRAHHAEYPFRAGITLSELGSQLPRRIPSAVIDLCAQRLVKAGQLTKDGANLRLHDFVPRAEADAGMRARVVDRLRDAGYTPPTAPELEAELDLPSKSFKELLAALVRSEELVHVAQKIYYERSVYERASEAVLDFANREGGITTQQAKALLEDLPRKFLIPLLESMDKRGLTARVGEVRKAR